MATETLNLEELAGAFTAAHPKLDPKSQRIVLATFRLLGEGRPLTPDAVARRVDRPDEEIASYLDQWPMLKRDEQGRIVGFAGLQLEPTSHALELKGRTLYAWCALDALFFPELLGQPAQIRSTCPQTGETITLRVDAAGVHDIAPQGAVMSLHDIKGFDLDDVIATFCCYVHFFASEDAARTWTEGKRGTYIVPIAFGYEYGHLYNRGRLGGALEDQ